MFPDKTNSTTSRLFVDGVEQTLALQAEGAILNVYRVSRDTTSSFNGTIDETRIHNRSLSDAEICESYNQGLKSHSFVIRGSGGVI